MAASQGTAAPAWRPPVVDCQAADTWYTVGQYVQATPGQPHIGARPRPASPADGQGGDQAPGLKINQ